VAKGENKTKINLGEDSIGRLLVSLAVPTIVAQLVNLLYNLVDRIYIGHISGEGELALTGLGLSLPIILAVTAFSSLVSGGGAPRAAINMGRNDNDAAEEILGNCFAMLLILSVSLTVIFEIFNEPLLRTFGASDATIGYALSYIRIYEAGSIFVMMSLGMNAFITTQGFTTISMKTVIIGAVCNIILDPIFIFALELGVKGAALATIISQAVSAVWVLHFLTGKKTKLKIKRKYLKIKASVILPVLGLGVSPFVMGITESFINIAFNSSLAKYGGDVAVGAMTIMSSVSQLQFMPINGLCQGAQPIISFNFGARKIDRVKKAFRITVAGCLIYAFSFWVAVEIAPGFFVKLFNSSSPELLAATSWMIRVFMATSCVFGAQCAIQNTFMALGQAKISLFIACLRKIIVLIPLIYIFPVFLENKVLAVILAEPVADFISVSVAATLFILNINKILAQAPAEKKAD